MMQEEEFDSDTSDEDYVLEKDVASPGSSEPESDEETQKINNMKKKGSKSESEFPNDTTAENVESIEDQNKVKEKETQLWADFLDDVTETPTPTTVKDTKKQSATTSKLVNDRNNKSNAVTENKVDDSQQKPVKITKIFEFAGEEVRVEEDATADDKKAVNVTPQDLSSNSKGNKRAGASSVLDMINYKRQKLSTLEKTKLDWNTFKKAEGIGDELELHKKSKSGYLEKQDFLARTDLKQFEIERAIRMKNRSKR